MEFQEQEENGTFVSSTLAKVDVEFQFSLHKDNEIRRKISGPQLAKHKHNGSVRLLAR